MDGWQVMEQANELARRGEAFALATVVWRQGPSSGQQGARAIITASGELHGFIGGACAEPSVIRQAREVIAEGKPRLLLLGRSEQFGDAIPEGMTVVPISCQSEGALEVYIEPVVPAPHLVVVGRSPMASALAGFARVLGWRADLLDWTDFSAGSADERSMVVVATQGHGDEEAAELAAAARPAYLGVVGSHRRGAALLGYLADRGVPRDQIDRIQIPAGLDLGRTTHVEIAVSILAELVRLRASGQIPAAPAGQPAAAPVAGTNGPVRAGPMQAGGEPVPAGGEPVPAGTGPAEAIDPVCGMTVTAGPAGRPLEHDGTTYYFCCAGCRGAFESDPASYARKETRC